MSDNDTPALDAWNTKYSSPENVLREAERLRERARHDEAQALHNAGRKVRIEIARNLLKRNRPVDEIAEDTGLTLDHIKRLRED